MATREAEALIAIMVTYGRPVDVGQHLAALEKSEARPRKLYIVDNGATEERGIALPVTTLNVEVLRPSENLGPAGGFDLGLKRALREDHDWAWVLLLDDDDPPRSTRVVADLLALAETLPTDIGALGLAGGTLRWSGITMESTLSTRDSLARADYLAGGYLPLYRRAALSAGSPFNPTLFFGFEELGAGLELQRRGFSLVAANELATAHGYGDDTPADRQRSEVRDYYATRNYLSIIKSYRPAIAPLVVLRQLAGLLRGTGELSRRAALRSRRQAWRDVARGSLGRYPSAPTSDSDGTAAPPRVLHLVVADQRRGAESAAVNLAAALETSLNQWVIALRPGPAGQGTLGLETLVRRLPAARSNPVAYVIPLAKKIRKLRPQVVVAHGGESMAVASLTLTLTRSPARLIWQRILVFPAGSLTSRRRRFLWRAVSRRVDGVVALTRRTGDECRLLGFRGPIWHIPNHRPKSLLEQPRIGRQRLGDMIEVDENALVFAFVGHLVEQKDPVRFIRVALRVLDAVPNAWAIIIGDGPLMDPVKAAIAASSDARILVVGHIDDVPDLLREVDVVVSTSRSESMTGSMIEAMMSGAVPVSLNLDGMDELMTDGSGIIVSTDDEMVAALVRLAFDRSELTGRGEMSRLRAHDFATETVSREFLTLLSILID